ALNPYYNFIRPQRNLESALYNLNMAERANQAQLRRLQQGLLAPSDAAATGIRGTYMNYSHCALPHYWQGNRARRHRQRQRTYQPLVETHLDRAANARHVGGAGPARRLERDHGQRSAHDELPAHAQRPRLHRRRSMGGLRYANWQA